MVKTTLEKIKSIRHKLHVEVSAERATKSANDALLEIQKETSIKGFRKGQVPLDVLKKYLGAEADKEIAKRIVKDTYVEALRQQSSIPISEPLVEYEAYVEGNPFIYRAEFEVTPEVLAPEHEGITLEKEKVVVTDDEIDGEVKRLQHAMTQLEPAPDSAIGPQTVAIIDFKGTVEGKPFKGSDAENFVVDYGTLLPAFEEKISGMKAGEERDITFTYPPDYFNRDIAGKEGIYHVKAKEIRKKIVPEINDDFAKSLGKFQNMNEVRQDIKKHITNAKEEYQRRRLGLMAIRHLAEKNAFEVPDVMIQNELGSMLEDVARQLQSHGQTLEEAGLDTKKFIEEHMEEATKRVRGYLIAFAIAKQGGVSVTDEELDTRMAAISRQTNQPVEKVKAHFEKENLKDQLRSQFLYEKTLDFIVGKAKVKEVKPKKEKK